MNSILHLTAEKSLTCDHNEEEEGRESQREKFTSLYVFDCYACTNKNYGDI